MDRREPVKFHIRDGIATTEYFNVSVYSDDYNLGVVFALGEEDARALGEALLKKAEQMKQKAKEDATKVHPSKA